MQILGWTLSDLNHGWKLNVDDNLGAEKELNDIKLISYDDDGDYIFLTYSANFNLDSLKDILELSYQIINEIDGAAELTIGAPFPKIEEMNNEIDFTQRVLVPIIRKLSFINVRYNHGKREFGKIFYSVGERNLMT